MLSNRPQRAARLLRRALDVLDGASDADAQVLRVRVRISLAYSVAELESAAEGLRLLDEVAGERAVAGDVFLGGALRAQRGFILVRHGQLAGALADLDAGIELMERAGASEERCRVLLSRGMAHLELHAPLRGGADFEQAAEVAEEAGLTVLAGMARHNAAYVAFLAGDLPRALRDMAAVGPMLAAAEPALRGVGLLDRARVLLAAGLLTEADTDLAAAVELFRRLRAGRDQAEAELSRAHLALSMGRHRDAGGLAGVAGRRFRLRGNQRWAMLAELTGLQAELATGRMVARTATRAGELAERLRAAGLGEDARAAALLAAEAGLRAGRPVEPPALSRRDQVGTRLLCRLVRAEVAQVRGDPHTRDRELRCGLTELHGYRARFGSLDLQTASALHGRRLAELGLAGALADGRPAIVHSWVERVRAVSLRLPPIRPPSDPRAAELLAELRAIRASLRAAELAGSRVDPASRARRGELEREIRQRSWHAPGSPVARTRERLARLGEVREAVGAADGCLVTYLAVAGTVHALVATRRRARVLALGPLDAVARQLRRVRADLDALALAAVPQRVREVVAASLAASLRALEELLWRPLAGNAGAGPVLVVPSPALLAVPWPQLAGLRGRPVAVAPSATWWLARRDRLRVDAPPVLAAGPRLHRAASEVEAAAAGWPTATVLRGPAATGAAVLAASAGAGLLHLAAHGVHEPDNPLFSAVELADGPLFGYDLPRAALPPQVILSACDLGLAVTRPGEETLGMTTALLHAGVSSVVAGVARIGDHVAEATMVAYHRRLRAGETPSAALAESTVDGQPAPLVCFGAGW